MEAGGLLFERFEADLPPSAPGSPSRKEPSLLASFASFAGGSRVGSSSPAKPEPKSSVVRHRAGLRNVMATSLRKADGVVGSVSCARGFKSVLQIEPKRRRAAVAKAKSPPKASGSSFAFEPREASAPTKMDWFNSWTRRRPVQCLDSAGLRWNRQRRRRPRPFGAIGGLTALHPEAH
jgi:hypothetical protein